MRLPYLPSWDNVPVLVTMKTEGIGENGEPEVLGQYDGKCNFVHKTKTAVGKDGRTVSLGGYLTIRGDIAPTIPLVTGEVVVDGRSRKIHSSEKVRNPDGSVNHTRLELLT
jgi:hypothetical protein